MIEVSGTVVRSLMTFKKLQRNAIQAVNVSAVFFQFLQK